MRLAHLGKGVRGGGMSTKWTATGGRGTEHAVFDEASRIVGFVDSFEPKDLATALAAPEMRDLLERLLYEAVLSDSWQAEIAVLLGGIDGASK